MRVKHLFHNQATSGRAWLVLLDGSFRRIEAWWTENHSEFTKQGLGKTRLARLWILTVALARCQTLPSAVGIGTRSHKRGTKSLGRSRDHWRTHHLEESFHDFNVFDLFHIVGHLLLTVHFDLYMSLKHISNDKSLLWLKQCKSFQLHFMEMPTLLPP